eukprot:13218177-Alexandrium_andersonii.AAC.1
MAVQGLEHGEGLVEADLRGAAAQWLPSPGRRVGTAAAAPGRRSPARNHGGAKADPQGGQTAWAPSGWPRHPR